MGVVTLTEYDRGRLGELVGALSLTGHAVPAALFARDMLGLPMEAGGLFLGPLIGLPLAGGALLLVLGAILLATGRRNQVAYGGLLVTLLADVLVFLAWPHALLALGALASATSVGLFLSLVRLDTGGRDRTELLVTVAAFLLAGFTVAVRLAQGS